MVNTTLWWLLLIPVALSALTLLLVPRLIGHSLGRAQLLGITAGGLVVSAIIMASAFYLAKGTKTADVEVWNGCVTSKEREHGSYVRTYECNCREVCSGSGQQRSCHRVCQTCYEHHYTVTWNVFTTIGTFVIDHKDWTSRAVYQLPNPRRWEVVQKNDPVSDARRHTNYVKAVPESLFRPAAADLKSKFAPLIPAYPSGVYDYYRVDRVLPVGVSVPNLREWNDRLQDSLKFIGPDKQVNAVIVLVNTADPNYEYALRDAWVSGKKNDVILVIGTTAYPKIDWVRVISWTDRERFKVSLRDDIMALQQVSVDEVLTTLLKNLSTFERKRMRDFEYLSAEIDPPLWVMVTVVVLVVGAYVGFWIFAYLDGRNSIRVIRPTFNPGGALHRLIARRK